MEKFETQCSSISGKTETIASTIYQLQESLEIFESKTGAVEHEMGDIVDVVVKQANDTCETNTLADNDSTFDIIREEKVEGTDKGVMKGELSGRKDANLNTIQSVASQPVNSLENKGSCQVIISAVSEDMSHENKETNDNGTRKDAILKSNQTINDVDITDMNHET